MSKPIEGCPQPETPIRERAWTAEQVERAAGQLCVRSRDDLDAERMLRAYAAALRQQTTNPPEIGSKLVGGVAVSDEARAGIDSPFNACMQNPQTLGDFVRLPDADRVAIGQHVVDRAIEMQKEVIAQNAQGEGKLVAWPNRLSNIPAGDGSGDRIVGFRISEGDPILGQYGLSEPLDWLRKVTIERHAERARVGMSDLIERLRALSRHEHDDLSIGDEAADEIERRHGIGGELIIARRERDEAIAERDALRARIEDAPVANVVGHDEAGDEVPMIYCPDGIAVGKRVALVMLEVGK